MRELPLGFSLRHRTRLLVWEYVEHSGRVDRVWLGFGSLSSPHTSLSADISWADNADRTSVVSGEEVLRFAFASKGMAGSQGGILVVISRDPVPAPGRSRRTGPVLPRELASLLSKSQRLACLVGASGHNRPLLPSHQRCDRSCHVRPMSATGAVGMHSVTATPLLTLLCDVEPGRCTGDAVRSSRRDEGRASGNKRDMIRRRGMSVC